MLIDRRCKEVRVELHGVWMERCVYVVQSETFMVVSGLRNDGAKLMALGRTLTLVTKGELSEGTTKQLVNT